MEVSGAAHNEKAVDSHLMNSFSGRTDRDSGAADEVIEKRPVEKRASCCLCLVAS